MPHDFVDKMDVHICVGYQVFGGRMNICFHDIRFPFGGFKTFLTKKYWRLNP